jgi:hypothetical protein
MKLIQDSPSKEGQDSFAMNMLQWKENGFYLETGAYMPHEYSNTYSLEKFFSWKGLSIEINKEWSDKFNSERDNPCYCADSITFNYLEALEKNNAPSQIDYLQLDVDPNYQTLATLKSLPHDQYRFSVITFEHDLYADRIHGINDGAMVQEESRKIFNELGYQRVVSNLMNGGNAFEDWYVDPLVIDEKIWSLTVSENINWNELFRD